MRLEDFPLGILKNLVPKPGGKLVYRCLNCKKEYSIEKLLYTCPECKEVLLIHDLQFKRLKKIEASQWKEIFDYRRMLNIPAFKGIYRYHEFIGPVMPENAIVYLGEAHTPIVKANLPLMERVGLEFYFKNDGQNPSASFKDRGMASALSYINYLVKTGLLSEVLAICASTGDTSAAAALYAAYLTPNIKSAVLLPHKKVTPQQLSQPLGNGAKVFEIPGVFDDCMKVVEFLADNYNVALLNSKNAWRILGQESYSYEIAQDFDYDLKNKVIFVPIGNAGNITAVMNGFLKFYEVGIIDTLPKIIGVQSVHADPVFQYYKEENPKKRKFVPVTVKPSVAQAAMIGNPVSMPRVIHLADLYNKKSEKQNVFVVAVEEQDIMDWQLTANRSGHIVCTHGGESLAGLIKAKSMGLVKDNETAILDSTAHMLKFSGFQDQYFENKFPPEYEVVPKPEFKNLPTLVKPDNLEKFPEPGKPLHGKDFNKFVKLTTKEIAQALDLKQK